jgi:acyl phosphate:glycerol-3-phosphate acyltransferase
LDVRTIGSGTIGATNVARAFDGGRARLGALVAVMAIDAAKGFAPTYAAMEVSGAAAAVATGAAALVGNYRPLFLRFRRGGKIVATGGGVLFGLAPKAAAIAAGLWILVALVTRYSSVASLVVAALLPVLAALTGRPWEVIAFTIALTFAIFALHRANIRRLAAGTEPRMSFRRNSPSSRAGPSSGRAA